MFWWQVSEAIKLGAQVIKENEISVDEIEQCLQELNVGIDSMKQVAEVLGNFGISIYFLLVE